MKTKAIVIANPEDDGMGVILNVLSESIADGLYGFDIVDFYPQFHNLVMATVDSLAEWYGNLDGAEAHRAALLKIAVDHLFKLEKIDIYVPNQIRDIHLELDEAWKNFINSLDDALTDTADELEPVE